MTSIQPARSPAALPDAGARPAAPFESPSEPAPRMDIASEPGMSDRQPVKEGVSIVVFSGDFDRVQAAFNIALGAASSGQPVTMFFTFWGLDVITRHDASRLRRDPLRTAFRWLKPGGARRLPLTRFNFLGLGPVLMRRLMGQFHMPTVDEMVDMAHALGVRLVACTVTMGVMGLTEADLLPIVDSYAGVATYLADARVRDVNLFI
jgi:peroxiredoxin family protein